MGRRNAYKTPSRVHCGTTKAYLTVQSDKLEERACLVVLADSFPGLRPTCSNSKTLSRSRSLVVAAVLELALPALLSAAATDPTARRAQSSCFATLTMVPTSPQRNRCVRSRSQALQPAIQTWRNLPAG